MRPVQVLLQAYYAENLGDDLFLKMLFERYPGVEWHLLRQPVRYLTIFKEMSNIRIYKNPYPSRLCRMFPSLPFRRFDAYLYIGGSIFMEHYSGHEHLSMRKHIANNFKRLGKKNFVIGANFGPYQTEKFSAGWTDAFQLYDDICFRDCASQNLFPDLRNIRVAPDCVFNLPADREETKHVRKVGISAIDFRQRTESQMYHAAYEKKLLELAAAYSARGVEITLFSFCSHEGDAEYAKELHGKITAQTGKPVNVEYYEGNINEFLAAYKQMDAIVGTRFHAIILALLFRQHVVPIAYNIKTLNAMKYLGLDNVSIPLEDLKNADVDALIAQSSRNKLPNLEAVCREAEKQFEKLDEFVNSRARQGERRC